MASGFFMRLRFYGRIRAMNFRSRLMTVASWLAVVALLMATLAPAISQTLAHMNGTASQFLVNICSVDGPRTLSIDLATFDAKRTNPDQSHAFKHCPFCTTHFNLLMPPQAHQFIPAQLAFEPMPRAFFQAPRQSHAWTPASPRAPPLFS